MSGRGQVCSNEGSCQVVDPCGPPSPHCTRGCGACRRDWGRGWSGHVPGGCSISSPRGAGGGGCTSFSSKALGGQCGGRIRAPVYRLASSRSAIIPLRMNTYPFSPLVLSLNGAGSQQTLQTPANTVLEMSEKIMRAGERRRAE